MTRAPCASARPRTRRVLVVDDDRDFAISLKNLLSLENYEVAVAEHAAGAIDLTRRFEADVAILDYRLGATIGLDLVAPLKARNPDIVCLLSTAYSNTDTAVKALRAGIYDYFHKPLDTELLLATLDRCFEMISLKAEVARAEKARREAKRHEAVAQVVGGVAHHYNNLFAIIQGNIECLAEQLDGDSAPLGFTDNALEAIDRAVAINQNLAAYARFQVLVPKMLDIGAYLREISDALERELKGNIVLDLRTDPSLWTVPADRAQLKAVLFCLLHNASDAMAKGGRVVITAENFDIAEPDGVKPGNPTRHVMVSVCDTGEGVPEDIIGRVFEPFFTRHGMALATGLGLSRVYGFAKQSGGFATIENNPDGGATVRLYLPVAEDDPARRV